MELSKAHSREERRALTQLQLWEPCEHRSPAGRQVPSSCCALSTPPGCCVPASLLPPLRFEYKAVFSGGVNYLILISDSKACRCSTQLLKPLDLQEFIAAD